MSDFAQAIKWAREGKEVRRKSWKGKSLKGYKPDISEYNNYSLEDFEATDWEIYENKTDELKTLKDLEQRDVDDVTNGMRYTTVKICELKAEAIKWVKEYDGLIKKETINWIKHFFNITEEDWMTNEQINAREHGEQ